MSYKKSFHDVSREINEEPNVVLIGQIHGGFKVTAQKFGQVYLLKGNWKPGGGGGLKSRGVICISMWLLGGRH